VHASTLAISKETHSPVILNFDIILRNSSELFITASYSTVVDDRNIKAKPSDFVEKDLLVPYHVTVLY
jgi:hypothetical protein